MRMSVFRPYPQKLNRRLATTDRVALAPVARPKVDEFNVVPKLVICTWFSTLLAESRNCRARRVSPKRQVRLSDELRLVTVRPGIVLRPALPYCPATGLVKARRLK